MFDDRRDASERQFAHEAALAFRNAARRNQLASAWAADTLGLNLEQATQFNQDLTAVLTEFDPAKAREETLRRLESLFDGRATREDIERQLGLFEEQASLLE